MIWRPPGLTETLLGKPYLARDFLLVSRLPRNTSGGDVILISGGHGAGTQSIELLLDDDAFPIQQLRELAVALRPYRYYQFVLEAYDLVHEPPMTIARRIELSRQCLPRPVTPGKNFFRA